MGTIPIGTTTTLAETSPLPTTYAAGATSPVQGAPTLPNGESPVHLCERARAALGEISTIPLLQYANRSLHSRHQPGRMASTRPYPSYRLSPSPAMDLAD